MSAQSLQSATPTRSFAGVFASLLIACGAGDGGGSLLPVHVDAAVLTDAAADASASELDARVVDATSGLRDAADPLGSSATRDAETTLILCGAQPDARCVEDAGLADARAPGACDGGAGACEAVSCDARQVMCKRAPPDCAEGEVPSVLDTCYGECVPLEQCVCHAAAECPMSDRYTCHMSAAHCGPYVN